MTEEEIFQHLYEVATNSKDPRGIVSACLVENGEILLAEASSDDGVYHAEDILFYIVKDQGLQISKNTILYTTLMPCTKRTKIGMTDCVSSIISSGIGKVVYGARDPIGEANAIKRLSEAGIEIVQTSNKDIVRKCTEIFNFSVAEEHIDVDVKLKPFN